LRDVTRACTDIFTVIFSSATPQATKDQDAAELAETAAEDEMDGNSAPQIVHSADHLSMLIDYLLTQQVNKWGKRISGINLFLSRTFAQVFSRLSLRLCRGTTQFHAADRWPSARQWSHGTPRISMPWLRLLRATFSLVVSGYAQQFKYYFFMHTAGWKRHSTMDITRMATTV